MQKKLLAVAVAGALVAPAAALAQSSVTVSGAINIWTEIAGANGGTNADVAGTGSEVKSRQRVQDGNGSNIRFTAVEDIGGGMQGFAQVESAVIANSDTRANSTGAAGGTSGWGQRNSGVGLRGSAWGEVLMGVWDVHYNEQYAVDNQLLKGPSHSSVLALMNSFGVIATTGAAAPNPTIGARYNNVIRYQSPNWSGFNFKASYTRPTDGVVVNSGTTANVQSGKKNTAINFAPQYSAGPVFVGYSYLKEKDLNFTGAALFANVTGGATITGAQTADITSHRISFAWTFPFGLKIGTSIDQSKFTTSATAPTAGSELKRSVVSFPMSFTTGPHAIFWNYAVASKLKGSINGADLSTISVTPAGGTASTLDSGTGAKFMTVGYQFDLSKRTNLHVNFSQIKNDQFASYDLFANGVGMTSANFGADPRIMSLGLRHAF